MIEIKKNVPMEEVFPLLEELTVEHWEEIANNKQVIKLNPDKDLFISLQKRGFLSNAFIYDDGVVVGYVVVITTPMLHYRDDKQSMVDVIYLKPSYRKGRLGIKLINLAEELAIENGATSIVHHTKPHHRSLEKIILKKGYKLAEYNLSKLLKKE